ncbi:hypothetical protein Zm00014a_006984 [Zea mays]|uniref:Calcium-dependent lipid-binding (CaLB domain) family protein n=2 Tax=Zea mays TaxID=4577 RepID=K7V1K3_MAIZE|nr:uncharacterized protein LOC107196794 [Zea mays]AQK98123.1 Calcium-dependent lipid-binding (CaLB domain) family protein [Zea mays]PWZ10956.1 hypothetical protein Zm00014a_006984 [Zea mays]|eukprot:NP_001307024.1 uncharacterized protein LOC107196794 [Zea mays]
MELPVSFLRDQGGGGGAEEQSGTQLEHEEDVPCVLDIFVHEARGTHKTIRVYGDHQDVYARLALTSAPEAGASARLGERLPPLRVARGRLAVDVLKCELWMRSGGVPDDQLLGFALVPLAAVAAADGARVIAADFELSSTDLLHSPAGAVRLSLALRPGHADACEPSEAAVLGLGPAPMAVDLDHSRIEFTDLRVRVEQEKSASSDGDGSTSRNAAASTASTVSEEDRAFSSSAEAAQQPPDVEEATTASAPVSRRSPDTPTSRGGKAKAKADVDVLPSPAGDIVDVEAEQSAMQRQIMEMYVKSMQQFSESLAKMQLPVALGGGGGVVEKEETPDDKKVIERQQGKKDGARVFYGSRAFF